MELGVTLAPLESSTYNFSALNDSGANSTSPGGPPGYFLYIRLLLASTYGILFVLGLANFLCIIAILKVAKLKQSVTNIYIMNLSIADAFYIVWIPFIVTMMFQRSWIFGEAMCKLYLIAESMNKYASVCLLMVLSVDRYLAICQPISSAKHRTPKSSMIVCLVCWILVAALMTPLYFYAKLVKDPFRNDTYGCYVVWPRNDNQLVSNATSRFAGIEVQFTLYSFVFVFLLPLLLVVFFYALVLIKLRAISNKTFRKQKKDAHYKRVTQMILAVIVCHVACWTPFWVMNLMVTLEAVQINIAVQILFNFLHMLPYLNSAINPLMYGVMNHNFRDAFIDMLCCCCPLAMKNVQHVRRRGSSISNNEPSRCPSRLTTATSNHLSVGHEFKSSIRSSSLVSAGWNPVSTVAPDYESDYALVKKPSLDPNGDIHETLSDKNNRL